MARMPGAQWRPLPGTSTTRISAYDITCFHTMVGSLAGTDNYFRLSAAGINSHFGVGADGTIFQWVDTAFRSGANYNGNYHIVSVETADTGAPFPAWRGSDVPAWTVAQIEACARIAAWAHETHGIPLDLIPDALPSRRGIGWHRQGVPGYMVPGAELWSTKPGKVCPGDRRVAQMPRLSARSRELAAGTPTEEDPLAALTDPEQRELLEAARYLMQGRGFDTYVHELPWRVRNEVATVLAALRPDVDEDALAKALAPLIAPSVIEALGEAKGITGADVEAAVRRVLADAADG